MSRALTVARREYVFNVTRWDFLVLTFGMPLFALIVGGLAVVPTVLLARSMPKHLTAGIVDETGRFEFPRRIKGWSMPGVTGKLTPPRPGYTLRRYPSRQAVDRALWAGEIQLWLVVPKDYVKTGTVLVRRQNPRSFVPRTPLPPLRPVLIRGLLKDHVDPDIIERVLDPVTIRERTPAHPGPGRKKKGPLAEMGEFIVPYAFMMLMMMSIFVSSGYLLRGITDEKDGRIIEIVLSSISADELFLGKLLGLSAVGLTQVTIWLALGVIPAMTVLTFVNVRPAAVALAPAFFFLGFLLYGTLIAGLGALGGNWRESQQLSAGISMLAVIPVIFFPVVLDAPHSPLAVGLSLFPFTSPLIMMVRLSTSGVPWWQILVALALLAASVYLAVRVAIRLFRTAILMYGKRPSVREVWRWLREA